MGDTDIHNDIRRATAEHLQAVTTNITRPMYKEQRPFSSDEAETLFEQQFDAIYKTARDALKRMENEQMVEYGVVPFETKKLNKAQNLADLFRSSIEQDQNAIYVNVNAAELRAGIWVARALKPAGRVIFNRDVVHAINSQDHIEDVAVKKLLSYARGGITELAYNAVSIPGMQEQSLGERYNAGVDIVTAMTDGLYDTNQNFYKAQHHVREISKHSGLERTRHAKLGSHDKEMLLQKDRWKTSFEKAATSELRAMLLVQERLKKEQENGIIVDYRLRPGSAEEDVLASTDLVTDVVYANGERIQTRYQIKSRTGNASLQNLPGSFEAKQYTFDPIHRTFFEEYDLANNVVLPGGSFDNFRRDIERQRMAGQLGYLSDAVYRDDSESSTFIKGKHQDTWPPVTDYRGAWIQMLQYN